MADLRSYIQGLDLDTGGGTDLIQAVALAVPGAGGAVVIEGTAANGLEVDVTRVTGTVTVDSELPAAAALSDAFANPTAPAVGAFLMTWDGTDWARAKEVVHAFDSAGPGLLGAAIVGEFDDASTAAVTENQFAPVRISSRRALLVEGVASGTSIIVDSELPAAAALTDNFANPTVPGVGAFHMVWDGSNWDRAPGTSADGLLVNLGANNDVTVTGTVTVDSELPAAAALADATANPTVPAVGSFLMGYNGTTWDRVRTANTGRLQVDVITGGGTETPTNPVIDYVTSASLAAGSEVNLDTAEAASKKLRRVDVWASVAYRARLFTVDNGSESAEPKAIGGGQAFQAWSYVTPHRNYIALGATAGADNFRVEVTNLDDANAADVYATFAYED